MPRLASVSEAYQVYVRGFGDHQWPPPATVAYDIPVPQLQAWTVLCGDLEEQLFGHTYWGTLYELYGLSPIPSTVALQVAKLLGASSVLTGVIGAIGHWPALYTVGRGIDPVDWERVTLRGNLGGVEHFQHKFDFRSITGTDYPTDEAGEETLAQFFNTSWTTALSFADGVTGGALLPRLSQQVAYTEVGCIHLTQSAAGGSPTQDHGTGWHAWSSTERPTGGAITSLPFEVATAVTLQSGTRGPRGRGRTYLPPFGTTQMDNDGTYLAAAVAAAGRCIGKFYDLIAADATWLPVVVSLAGGASHEITEASIGKIPDSQRRRRRSQVEANVVVWNS